MNTAIFGSLTDQHLLQFGKIIQLFARYELLMQQVMATVSGADPAAILLLTRGLDFSAKRTALLDLLYHGTIPLDQYDRINAFLMVPHTLTPLRNDIAHAGWISDTFSSWIQPDWILQLPPSVRPLRDASGSSGAHFIEREQDKTAYTLDGLDQIVESLATNCQDLSGYLCEIGLIRAQGEILAAHA